MKTFNRFGYIFFIAAYVFVGIWLYKSISDTYQFCLAGNSSINMFGLLSGISALCTVPFYVNHQRSSVKVFGYITLALGLLVLAVIGYRFLAGAPVCLLQK